MSRPMIEALTGALLAAFLFVAPAAAQASDDFPSEPPAAGVPRPFKLPGYESVALENGAQATFIHFGTVPKFTIVVVVRTGNLNEEGRTWLADLAGELMLEGAGGLTGSEIAFRAADMGGGLAISVSSDTTTIAISALSEFADEAMELIGMVLTDPAFPENELARIRQDFLRNLSVSRAQQQSLAQEAFAAALYGDHSYGRIFPDADELAAYEINDVRGYYEANFGARRTHVYVAGQFDRAVMETAIGQALGSWRAGPEALIDVPRTNTGRRVILVDRPGAVQSTIYLGLPVIDVNDPDYINLQVAHTMLGGAFGSRITRNIREDKGYTYSPRSSIFTRYHDAYWVQSADVTTEFTGPALAEIFKEIDRLQGELPPAEELLGVKNYRAGIFVLQNASRSGLIGQLSLLDYLGLDRSYLEDYVGRIFEVTAEDVTRVTSTYLRDEDMALVVVGDLAKITDQLRALPQLQGVEFQQ